MLLNETHDASLVSRVASANTPNTDFPIQNLPFCVFRKRGTTQDFRGGVAIGDEIVDLAALAAKDYVDAFSEPAYVALMAATKPKLNALMALSPNHWSALRLALSRLLRQDATESLEGVLVAQSDAEYDVPALIGDYTDFYTSVYHATNIGKLFRPDNPLLPNYKWLPIGYHGRSSSIVISGTNIVRPQGQTKAPDAEVPSFGVSQRMDYELELGIFAGQGNQLGEPIAMDAAEDHVFGICLLNDWSARDIQPWEYQPLGPFLSKNFATSVSPWIVTLEALAPFRLPFSRDADDPQPLAYLDSEQNRNQGAFDIELEILLQTQAMRDANQPPVCIGTSNYKYAYWTLAQLVAHHTVNGCNLQAGDLLGTGTLSGPDENTQAGALIELTRAGKAPYTLPNGETRTFLADGDTIIIKGKTGSSNAQQVKIGFGEVTATLLPAISYKA